MAGKVIILAFACGLSWPASASAQTKLLETQAFSTALSVSSSSVKKLESVVGEISGARASGKAARIVSGHSGNSHTPGVLSDIQASTGSVGEGQASLTWTNAGRDGGIGQAAYFEFRIATMPISNANFSSIPQAVNVTALAPGAAAQRLLTSLPPGASYYIAARTRDGANIHGRVSPNAVFATFATAPDSTTVTAESDSSGAMALSWNVTGDDGSLNSLSTGSFRIDYATVPPAQHSFSNSAYLVQIATSNQAAGAAERYRLDNLLGNVTYYAAVYIGDDVTVYSSSSNISAIMTQAYPPVLTGFTNISTRGFTASFSANNAAGTQYLMEVSVSTDYASAASSGWTAASSITFNSLLPRTTYYVRSKARNFNNIQTAYAEFGSLFLPRVSGTYNPRKALARGAYSGFGFTLLWEPVTGDVAGGTITINRYDIYQSTSAGGTAQLILSVPGDTNIWSASAGSLKWYSVKAVDTNNNVGEESARVKNSDGEAVAASDDKKAYMAIPKPVNDALAEGGITPVAVNQPEQETGSAVAAYKVYFLDERNNIVLNRDFPGDVSFIMPLSGGSPLVQAVYSEYDYAVFYDNGVEEVKLGGVVNPSAGTILVTTRKTGAFKVRRVVRPQSFAVTQTVPKKIFTPNGDGINDEFTIIYENPQPLNISEGKVYELSGAEAAGLKTGCSYSADALCWDGKRTGGEKAASGVYIYQFKAGNKYYNGTIVLAR